MKFFGLVYGVIADLIVRYLPAPKIKDKFAFIGHPREIEELGKQFPFIKFLPKFIVLLFSRHMWPVRVSKITGFNDLSGKKVEGYLIIISMPAEQMLKEKKQASKKIIQAVKLAEKRGSNIVGLGALTSSVTNGGKDLIGKVNTNLTTGNTLTAYITFLDVQGIAKNKNIDLNKEVIAIIGATGSIGSAVAKLFAQNYASSLILVGKTQSHIDELKDEFKNISNNKILITDSLDKINSAGVVIVATSSSSAFIHSNHLKQGAVVYDITQPRNVSGEVLKERKDITMIDGGLVRIPGARINFNVGLPKEVFFSCLAETMILSAEKTFDKLSLGHVELDGIEFIKDKFNKYKFELYNKG